MAPRFVLLALLTCSFRLRTARRLLCSSTKSWCSVSTRAPQFTASLAHRRPRSIARSKSPKKRQPSTRSEVRCSCVRSMRMVIVSSQRRNGAFSSTKTNWTRWTSQLHCFFRFHHRVNVLQEEAGCAGPASAGATSDPADCRDSCGAVPQIIAVGSHADCCRTLSASETSCTSAFAKWKAKRS